MGRVSAANRVGSCWLTAALLLTATASAQRPESVVFTADVRLVTLPATVKDSRGVPIGDLDREDFTVMEEGEPRDLAVFERRTNRPLSVVLMLDASLSTAIELRYERQSASTFLASLLGPESEPADQAAVYSFSSEVTVLQSFTRDRAALDKALGRVRPQTGTSVYDAVLLASEQLARRKGRRVIVMITDGGDTTSYVRFGDALRASHDAEVAVYPLIVLPIRSDAGRNRGGEHALITLAQNTGGESFVQYGAANLDEAFAEVLRNLRTQYMLGFYPRGDSLQTRERFRNVKIRVKREGAEVLVRSGYFHVPPPPEPERDATRRTERAPVRLRTLPQAKPESEGESQAAETEVKQLPPRRSPDAPPRPPIVRPRSQP